MNIKDQVLSIEQVRELQELGFDVEKYASMCWVTYTSDEEPYEKEYNLSILDEFCYESASLEPTPTMSIGDIIEVLPNLINIERFLYRLEINNPSVYYIDRIKNTGIYFYNNGLIDNLFETLKWCIKQKHIEL